MLPNVNAKNCVVNNLGYFRIKKYFVAYQFFRVYSLMQVKTFYHYIYIQP